jgi:hypothetical protein
MSDPEKVEVRVGDQTVEVQPKFRRVASGVLTMGFPLVDVHQAPGEDSFCLVFLGSDETEAFADFLVIHGMFRDPDTGKAEVHGSFMMSMEEGEDPAPTYFLDVPEEHLSELESCLDAHAPVPSSTSGTLN